MKKYTVRKRHTKRRRRRNKRTRRDGGRFTSLKNTISDKISDMKTGMLGAFPPVKPQITTSKDNNYYVLDQNGLLQMITLNKIRETIENIYIDDKLRNLVWVLAVGTINLTPPDRAGIMSMLTGNIKPSNPSNQENTQQNTYNDANKIYMLLSYIDCHTRHTDYQKCIETNIIKAKQIFERYGLYEKKKQPPTISEMKEK